jgi:hypothetical protein
MSQICLNELQNSPLAPPTNKVRVFVGSDGVLRSIDSAGVVTVYAPQNAISAFLQYSSGSQLQTNSTTGVAIPLTVDRDSNPNTFLEKINATDFLVKASCYVYVRFTANPFTSGNDRGYRVFVRKNSSDLSWTKCKGWSKNTPNRSAGVSGTFIILCDFEDIIQFRLASEEGETITLDADEVTCSVEIFKLSN